MTMKDVTFRFNQCSRGSQLSDANQLRNVSFVGNRMSGSGRRQGLITIPSGSKTTIRGLLADDNNGTVIRVNGGRLDVRDSFFMRNTGNYNGSIVASKSNVSFSTSIFDSNSYEERGGAVHLSGQSNGNFVSVIFRDNRAWLGGAVYVINPRVLQITSCLFERNKASRRRPNGEFYGEGGALSIQGGKGSREAVAEISDSIVRQNSAVDYGGGILVYDWVSGSLTLRTSLFAENRVGTRRWWGYGGGMSIVRARRFNLSILESDFESNKAEFGGAVYGCELSGNFSFRAINFTKNEADFDGGAMFLNNEFYSRNNVDVKIRGCHFLRNKGSKGGAIRFLGSGDTGLTRDYSAEIMTSNCKFFRNKAEACGAIDMTAATDFKMRHCEFRRNEADQQGGALCLKDVRRYSWSSHDVQMQNSIFVLNKAELGGGLHSSDSSIISKECFFERNEATIGGAICHSSSVATQSSVLKSSTLFGNRARIGGKSHNQESLTC